MVIDTSALVAILVDENEKPAFAAAIDTAADPKISAVTRVETAMVCLGRRRSELSDVLDLIDILGLKIIDVDRAGDDHRRHVELACGHWLCRR